MRTFCLIALLGASLPAAAAAQARTYTVDAEASRLTVHAGRAGLFKFAGHEHEIAAGKFNGEVVADPADIGRSSVSLVFDAGSLKVLAEGEPPEDAPKVQTRMLGADVLDAVRFPEISFRSLKVEGRQESEGIYNVRVTGGLGVRGRTQELTLPLRVEIAADTLTAMGQAVIRQSGFGITPVSVGGVVKVKDELAVEYKIVAKAVQ